MLQSHYAPYKPLKDHIAEVQQAAALILARHSSGVQEWVKNWVPLAITFHDIGKGTTEFQHYIQNPSAYKGTKASKSHTPMSLYWWYSYAFHHQLDFETTLAVAVAVWKHHSAFPTYSGDAGIQESVSQYHDLLKKQLQRLNLVALDQTLNLTLSNIPPTPVSGLQVHRYFYRNPLPEDTPAQLDATTFRLRVQLLFSILLEADKAFLALKGEPLATYKSPKKPFYIPHTLVSRLFPESQTNDLNHLRTRVRQGILTQPLHPVSLVSLPTGLGKTMVAAEWFLKHRVSENNTQRKVIVVLPFLSIIDQTVKEYQRLLAQEGLQACILESHSLSTNNDTQRPKPAELDMEDAEDADERGQENSTDFLAKIWDKPIVITTFDQFLYALLSPKGKHQMRFHNIADALVIMD